MIRRDWLKRQVEILAQALGSVLGLKRKGEIQAALAAIETSVQRTCGMSGQLALALPLEEFIKLACRGEDPSPELLSAMADIFREWASLLNTQERRAEAASALARAQELVELAESRRPS